MCKVVPATDVCLTHMHGAQLQPDEGSCWTKLETGKRALIAARLRSLVTAQIVAGGAAGAHTCGIITNGFDGGIVFRSKARSEFMNKAEFS